MKYNLNLTEFGHYLKLFDNDHRDTQMKLHNDLTQKAAEIRLTVLETALKVEKGRPPALFRLISP